MAITVEHTRGARHALQTLAAIELPADHPQLAAAEQAIDFLDGFLTLVEQAEAEAIPLVPVQQIGRRMLARTFARGGPKVPNGA